MVVDTPLKGAFAVLTWIHHRSVCYLRPEDSELIHYQTFHECPLAKQYNKYLQDGIIVLSLLFQSKYKIDKQEHQIIAMKHIYICFKTCSNHVLFTRVYLSDVILNSWRDQLIIKSLLIKMRLELFIMNFFCFQFLI
jgi:hypothetical protein